MSEMLRVRARIRGRVQGVWFRAETKKAAVARNLSGWVRNMPDGSVEAVFEGEKPNVESVLEWCKKGPPLARVSAVDVTDEPAGEPFSGFSIAY
ncbi:MAG: acylphosphatase [Thermodesulfobacteriota bacterium]